MSIDVVRRADGIADIVLSRPEKRNAMNLEMIADLKTAALSLAEEDALRCVVLRGDGKVFSAGADVSVLANLDSVSAFEFIDNLRSAIDAVFALPVPVICQLHGACIGGALELAAVCDLRLADPDTLFCMPEVRVGIPSVIQAGLLPKLMGYGRASWFVLSGETIAATEAMAWGLVDRIAGPMEMSDAVDRACANVLASAPNAVRMQKRLNREWHSLSLDDWIEKSMHTFSDAYKRSEPFDYMSNHK